MKAYLIPAETVEFSEEIKKSRFITFIAHTEGIDAAKAYIQSIKEQFPDARHHCWAFVAGRPDDSQQLGFSDDGEPTGTAGKPILAPLLGSGMGEVTAVVVRYFGGIKLGTGGLVRAYGSGVQQALKLLPTKTKVPQLRFSVACEYSLVSLLEQVVEQYHGQVLSSEYTDKVTFILSLPAMHSGEVEVKLRDISRGSMQLIPLDKNE
ncbi:MULTISPECIES: IMPACT family protein [Proteus]|uniref:IMPACT family protein n=1 Tax=Proteus terrae subsp. cibarius TaxID=626774 RepID=A0A6G6SQ65_9GAMM|nr:MULTISPECIES: IMPACT family protein [Proteus]QHP75168.1 IMPACT family protein [Proteus vulgaris]MBG2915300.1 IMPACT family protein [Proteus terrae subsp. cibarius]MBG3091168.1 IMPACT family protein [Proteus terrae subsp. cibarius]MCM2368474.1 IMPACT family protein [Proteus sp. FZP2095]MCO4181556.1 IMPACT family protein [Proteus terrae]